MRLPRFGAITPEQIKPKFAFKPAPDMAHFYEHPCVFVVHPYKPISSLHDDTLILNVLKYRLDESGIRGQKTGHARQIRLDFRRDEHGQLMHKGYDPAGVVEIHSSGERLEILPPIVEVEKESLFKRLTPKALRRRSD